MKIPNRLLTAFLLPSPGWLVGLITFICVAAFGLGFIRPTDALKSWVWGVLISVLLFKGFSYFSIKVQKPLFFIWVFLFVFDLAVQGVLRGFFGANPSPSIIAESLANTSVTETIDFFTSQSSSLWMASVYVLVSMGVVALMCRLYFQACLQFSQKRSKWFFIGLLLLVMLIHFNPTMLRQQPLLRWSVVYVRHIDAQADIQQALTMRQSVEQTKSQWGVSVSKEAKTVVLVIGESDSRHNWSWYGYERPTNAPLEATLKALGGTVTQLTQAKSAQAYTLPALKLALTPAALDQPELWRTYPDIFLLAKAAGYHITWLSNQVASEGWLSLMGKSADIFAFVNKGNWRDSSSTDFALLPELAKQLDKPAPVKELIVLHLLGQHFQYDLRCPNEPAMRPFSRVNDDTVMKKMQALGRNTSTRQTRNEYDNAVFCGSVFQSKVLQAIQAKRGDRALEYVYFSDHGQEVGHTQNYAGHSDTSEFGFTVPVFTWSTSPNEPKISRNIKIDIPYSTQHMEHFIQGSLGITSKFYNAQLDPMSASRKIVAP